MMILFGMNNCLIRYAELHACSLERSKEILYDFYQAHNHTLEWYSSRFWTAKVGVDMLAMQLEYKDQVTLRATRYRVTGIFKK